jgi:enoyl-CoA hydratase/carnithine racemase
MRDELIIERADDHVLVFKLNRPEVRNALNPLMTQALADGLAAAELDERIRACVLGSTTPTSFCSGADLRVVASDALGALSRAFRTVVRASRAKPLIAAVSGAAVGGGLELCLACDMVVAGNSSSFGLPEPRRGIIAAGGGVIRLPRVVPRAIALEMITTGEPIDARTAHRHGLVNRLVPTADVLPTAIELALQISACSPLAVRESLWVARCAVNLPEDEVWRLSRDAGARVIVGEDAREGPRAFLEKRLPQWRS